MLRGGDRLHDRQGACSQDCCVPHFIGAVRRFHSAKSLLAVGPQGVWFGMAKNPCPGSALALGALSPLQHLPLSRPLRSLSFPASPVPINISSSCFCSAAPLSGSRPALHNSPPLEPLDLSLVSPELQRQRGVAPGYPAREVPFGHLSLWLQGCDLGTAEVCGTVLVLIP